jgi:hypothetical protein
MFRSLIHASTVKNDLALAHSFGFPQTPSFIIVKNCSSLFIIEMIGATIIIIAKGFVAGYELPLFISTFIINSY